MLFRSHYGIDYNTPEERYLILKMMEAALAKGDAWQQCNQEVDALLMGSSKQQIKEQIDRTASAFAVDMLLLKFVQGIPVVGIIGGAGNPVYYHKILKYVKLKYQKRYLITLQREYTAKDLYTDKC